MTLFRTARTVALAALLCCALALPGALLSANEEGPFAALAGWWAGEGRLRFKGGKQEQVKCRATYFVSEDGVELKQNVRCASESGKIEVQSTVRHHSGTLTGSWSELLYNMAGELSGEVTGRGYRVAVKDAADALSANMDIIVRENKQIVEIQFFSETLVGLTLVLEKG
jgi:hypothetical protein